MSLKCVLNAHLIICAKPLFFFSFHLGSLNKSQHCGSIEAGKWGDLVIVRAANWEHIIYQLVDAPIAHVVKKGRVLFAAPHPHFNILITPT